MIVKTVLLGLAVIVVTGCQTTDRNGYISSLDTRPIPTKESEVARECVLIEKEIKRNEKLFYTSTAEAHLSQLKIQARHNVSKLKSRASAIGCDGSELVDQATPVEESGDS